MLPFLLYYILLVLWLPLLWPAFRLTGKARAWLLIVVAAGLSAGLYEAWMWFSGPAGIRFDILLLAPVLLCLYASAAAVLWWRQWRRAALAFGLLVAVVGGLMAHLWIAAGRESARLTEVFHAGNALLFEAKFRSDDDYRAYFGLEETNAANFPIGHWLAQDGGHFTRLVVNPAGRAWLFFRCGETECHHGPGEQGLQPAAGGAWKAWQGTLKPRVGNPVPLRIIQESSARLSVEVKGRQVVFAAAPPPVAAAAGSRSIEYLGAYAALVCEERHSVLRQLWLWRDETRVYAIALAASVVAGRRADFLTPHVLGAGTRDGDRWSFGWQHNGQQWQASVVLDGSGADFTLQIGNREPEAVKLRRGAIIGDEVVELAPLTTKADWDHWFDTVLTGHFSSGPVPDC